MNERSRGSHVREDGLAKIAFETREAAAAEADKLWQRTGKPHNVYRCAQRPEHWHIGGGVADLV